MQERADNTAAPFAGVTVMAVFAHPDDESLSCGGTLAGLASEGARVVVVCGSRGEEGWHPDVGDGNVVGDLRVKELKRAAAHLGVSALAVLNHPDGNLRWVHRADLMADVVFLLRRHRPAAVITFGEDGLYWHPDHLGVHEWTTAAVQAMGHDAPALYYVTIPVGTMRGIVDDAAARGWTPPADGFWSLNPDAFGLHALAPSILVDVEPWIASKLAALRCHQTQFGRADPFSLLGEDEARRWLGREHFHRAVGVGQAAAPILEQFAGLAGRDRAARASARGRRMLR